VPSLAAYLILSTFLAFKEKIHGTGLLDLPGAQFSYITSEKWSLSSQWMMIAFLLIHFLWLFLAHLMLCFSSEFLHSSKLC
jgi:hypothetical protein